MTFPSNPMRFLSNIVLVAIALILTGGIAAAQTMPLFECVSRPKGLRPPPSRLPMLRHELHKPGDSGADRAEVKELDKHWEEDADVNCATVCRLRFKPVCPEGKVPVSRRKPYRGPKGNPLFAPDPGREIFKARDRAAFVRRHVRPFEQVYGPKKDQRLEEKQNPPPPPPGAPACDGTPWYGSCFYYGSAAFYRAADGAGMTQSIEKPQYVNVDGATTQGHSLDEIALMDSGSIFNTVELGWFVSRDVYGDDDPHIFVYHWIQAAQTCYDDCGWQQYSSTYYPGMNLGTAVGKKVYIGYVYFEGNWWAWFDDQWMGYFPGTLWNNVFTKTALIQWFGEVASQNGIPPQTQMGNGTFPNTPSAASMTTLCDVDAKAWVCWYRDQQSLGATPPNPKYYDIVRSDFGATRYGGPGN